jgi:hypothetical protein
MQSWLQVNNDAGCRSVITLFIYAFFMILPYFLEILEGNFVGKL